MASSSDDESVIIWQTDTGSQLNTLSGHDNKIEKVLFIKNEKAILNIYSSEYVSTFNKTLVGYVIEAVNNTGMADENQLREIYEEHRLVYGAVLAHDAEAAGRYMEEHLHKSMLRYNYR